MRPMLATLRLLCALSALSVLDAPTTGAAPLVVTSGANGAHEETIFGYALAAAGADIVVGAPHTTVRGAAQAGAVYVFDGASGAPRLALQDPMHAKDDLFGHAVAATRDRILVGAPRTQTDGLVMAGAAYLFDGRSGELLRTFAEPTPAANAEFGSAVAFAGDGVLVAAPAASVGAAGAAGRIYRFDAAGKVAQTFSAAPPRPYEIFGTAFTVAGGDLLVGSPQATVAERAHAGAAY